MATALYRRYRPESFAEVIGQDHVTTPLMRALCAGRVGHAYLFSGPRGCGKTTSARILARCLNCAEGPTDTPCGQCDSCRDLARGGPGSLDVVEIDAASHGGVDDARELRERATFAPARDRYKVFIIDEAHMVTSAGFNALLKLVEEPPEHVKFVFATTEPDKVIGTIRSRTHHYPFRLIPPQVLTPYLQDLCEAEHVPVGEGVLPLVVRAGGGSARDTLSVLDQLMAGAAEEGLDQATAIALLGFTDTALLDGAVEAIAAGDGGALYQVTDQVLATGHEPRRFVEDLLERVRDLIVLAAVPDRAQDLLPQIPADDLERMRHQAGLFSPADLSRCGDLVHETLSSMSGATSPRLHLELLAARLVLRGQAAPAPAVGGVPAGTPTGPPQRGPVGGGAPQGAAPAQGADGNGREMARRIAAERAEAARRARGGPGAEVPRRPAQGPAQDSAQEEPSTPATGAPRAVAPQDPRQQSRSPSAQDRPQAPAGQERPPSDPGEERRAAARSSWGDAAGAWSRSAARPPAQETAAPGGLDVEEVRGHWSAILDQLHEIRRAAHALVSQNAQVVDVRGTTIVLGFRSEGLVNAFRRGPMAQNVADAARRILRTEVSVEAVVGDGPAGGSAGSNGPSGGTGGSNGGPNAGTGGPTGSAGGSGRPGGGPGDGSGGLGDVNRPSGSTGPMGGARQGGQAPSAGGEGSQGSAQSLAERMERNAARARGARPAQAAPVDDFAPEPDDPYGEPYDDAPPPGEDFHSASPQRPAVAQPLRPAATAQSPRPDAASQPDRDGPAQDRAAQDAVRSAADSTEASAVDTSDGPVPVVEDEGRDTLPAGEPRTYGQAALKKALAEGRVVHSRPATRETDAPAAPADRAANDDVPEGSSSREPDTPSDAAPLSGQAAPSDAPPASGGIPGWDTPVDRGPARAGSAGPASGREDAAAAPAGGSSSAPGPARRSGADLVREAAHAAHVASIAQRGRGGRSGRQAEPPAPVDDDPTGGASRDDADAEYTQRSGREVIEAVLGGRVLEVIDETGR